LSVEIYNRIYSNEFGTAAAYGTLQMVLILLVLAMSQRLETPRRGRKSRAAFWGPGRSAALAPALAPTLNPIHETGENDEHVNEPVTAAPRA
jgi:iron(III) transport system permease protein